MKRCSLWSWPFLFVSAIAAQAVVPDDKSQINVPQMSSAPAIDGKVETREWREVRRWWRQHREPDSAK